MEGISNIERKEMSPVEILKYMEKMGKDLEQYAIQARAMIEEAGEKNIPVNMANNETLKKFSPTGEYESMLVKIKSELLGISGDLNAQGVKMTAEDLKVRLEKMEK